MKQSEIVAAVAGGRAAFCWVALLPNVEVMAWPARVDGGFCAVSARTAQACAAALNGDGWRVTLTTPKIEDLIYENAAHRSEPITFNPAQLDISAESTIARHSDKLLALLAGVAEDALVVAGKNWVLSSKLSAHPGRAANYGFFSAKAHSLSENGLHRLLQPLSFFHNTDHFDYSQLLRLVRRRPGTELPAYDAPLTLAEANPA